MSRISETVPPLDKPRLKPLDCVENAVTGKADFQPCPEKPIVYGVGQVPEARLDELAAVIRERDALHDILGQLVEAKNEKDANGESPHYHELKRGLWERARETLAKLPTR